MQLENKLWTPLDYGEYTYCGDAIIEAQSISHCLLKRVKVFDKVQCKTIVEFSSSKLFETS